VILAPAGGAIDSSHLFTGGEKLDPGSFELRRDGRVCAGDGSPVERPASEAERVRRKVGSLLGDAAECSEGGADDVSLEEIETALLKSAVRVAEGNLAAAARRLGITRPQLVYRLKSRGLLGAEH
jgi:DNA-binding NtrC family response regulator